MASGIKIKQEEAELKIQNRCKVLNYTYKPFVYKNTKTKITMKCSNQEHAEWVVSFSKFIYKGTKCPECNGRNFLSEKTARIKVNELCIKKKYKCEPFVFCGAVGTHLVIKCNIENHPPFNTNYNKLINCNYGCPLCGGHQKHTQDYVDEMVSKRCTEINYTYKPFIYKNLNSLIYLKCSNIDHIEFQMSYENFILHKYGCKLCGRESASKKLKLTQVEAEKRLTEICISRNYTFEPFVYNNMNTLINLKCSEPTHPVWKTRYTNIVTKKRGCPSCCVGGYNPSEPGYFYIHKIYSNCGIYYKFGITNNYEKRFLSYSNNNFKTEKFKAYYSLDGRLISEIEYFIKYKSEITREVIDKADYLDGYTETINESGLDMLISIVEKYDVESIDVV